MLGIRAVALALPRSESGEGDRWVHKLCQPCDKCCKGGSKVVSRCVGRNHSSLPVRAREAVGPRSGEDRETVLRDLTRASEEPVLY